MQSTKFDAMTEMFRDMILHNMTGTRARSPDPADNPPSRSTTPPPSGAAGGNATKRNATVDLESVLESEDDRMEVDSEPESSSSRKRNDVRPSPVKPPLQLFPLFKKDSESNNDISRNLFGGTPQKANPTEVPLPLSPVQDKSTHTSLNVPEDVHRSTSSGNESETQTMSSPQEDEVSTPDANHVR
jgi:hypothetical protein